MTTRFYQLTDDQAEEARNLALNAATSIKSNPMLCHSLVPRLSDLADCFKLKHSKPVHDFDRDEALSALRDIEEGGLVAPELASRITAIRKALQG